MQQVNLYTEDLRPRKDPLTLNHAVLYTGMAVLVIALASLWARWDLARLQDRENRLASQLEQTRQQVESLSAQLEKRAPDAALERSVSQAREQLQTRRKLADRMGRLAKAGARGFSPYLEGLAKQIVPDLWITSLAISLPDQALQLEGMTRDGDQVLAYLQRLEQEPVFSGRRFSYFQLQRDEDSPAGLTFMLASQRPGEER